MGKQELWNRDSTGLCLVKAQDTDTKTPTPLQEEFPKSDSFCTVKNNNNKIKIES